MTYEGVEIDVSPLIPWLKSLGFCASRVQNPYKGFPDMIEIYWEMETLPDGSMKGYLERSQAYPVDWCHKVHLSDVPLRLAGLAEEPTLKFSNQYVVVARKILTRRLETGI